MSTEMVRLTFTLPSDEGELLAALAPEAGVTGFQEEDHTTLCGDLQEGQARYHLYAERDEIEHILTSLEQALEPFWGTRDLRSRLTTSVVDPTDWATSWREGIGPIALPPFVVVPSWVEYAPREGEILLTLDPGMAFGTGSHATTQMAAQALSALAAEGKSYNRSLDLGSGTGILALMIRHLFQGKVTGVEIDEEALKASKEIVKENGFDDITLRNTIPTESLYELIVANINGPALLDMKELILSHLAPGGTLILTGILDTQADSIKKTYGLAPQKEVSADEWILFQFKSR